MVNAQEHPRQHAEVLDLYNDICRLIDWTESGKYQEVSYNKITLMNMYPFKNLEMVTELVISLRDELSNSVEQFAKQHALSEFEGFGGSDSTLDCLYEITSMGYEAYLSFCQNPGLVIDYYKKESFAESFIYCFPYDFEYQYGVLDYYKKSAAELQSKVPAFVLHVGAKNEILQILDELRCGIFDSRRSYDQIYDLSKKLGLGAEIANLWSDGLNYYGKIKKDINFFNLTQ